MRETAIDENRSQVPNEALKPPISAVIFVTRSSPRGILIRYILALGFGIRPERQVALVYNPRRCLHVLAAHLFDTPINVVSSS